MRKLIAVTVLIFCMMSILAGDNFVLVTYGDLVPIYPTAFATQPKLIIQQVDEVEAVYAFKVLDDSVFRFKVEIFEPDRCTYDGKPYLSSIGWIDKIHTCVYVRATLQADGETCLRLYEQPDTGSEFVSIAKDDHMDYIAYVDSISDDWYHIVLMYEGKLYKGEAVS